MKDRLHKRMEDLEMQYKLRWGARLDEFHDGLSDNQRANRIMAIFKRYEGVLASGETPTSEERHQVRRMCEIFDTAHLRVREVSDTEPFEYVAWLDETESREHDAQA